MPLGSRRRAGVARSQQSGTVPSPTALADRRAHYSDFYDTPSPDGRRVVLAVGNCQAESLRIVLPDDELQTVRIPPVHELTPADLPALEAWLTHTDVLVTQPIRDDYRGLPVGASQLVARMPSAAEAVVVPVIRFAGLYPRHAIIRPPSDPSLVPPVVAYHDLAVLLEAAGEELPPLRRETVLAVRDESIGQLRAREEAHRTVLVSDLFARPDFAQMRTINHPGNPVWLAVGQRVLDGLGVDAEVRDPGRPLLDAVHAPREQVVIDAFGLDASPDAQWTVDGRRIDSDTVRAAHLAWYAEHPDAVAAGLARHRDVLELLRA